MPVVWLTVMELKFYGITIMSYHQIAPDSNYLHKQTAADTPKIIWRQIVLSVVTIAPKAMILLRIFY